MGWSKMARVYASSSGQRSCLIPPETMGKMLMLLGGDNC